MSQDLEAELRALLRRAISDGRIIAKTGDDSTVVETRIEILYSDLKAILDKHKEPK